MRKINIHPLMKDEGMIDKNFDTDACKIKFCVYTLHSDFLCITSSLMILYPYIIYVSLMFILN